MKKILSLVLCTVMILTLFTIIPFSVSAEETDATSVSISSGTTGDCTWTLDDDGVLIISGEGEMEDYGLWENLAPWRGNIIFQAIIKDGVKHIGNNAFPSCTVLKSVTIPDSVTSIGENAFDNCISLTEVTIPDSVTSIGKSAFSSCTVLKSVTIPDSVTSIGGSVFSDCTGLESVTIGNSVTSIGDFAFSGCTGLTNINIPNSIISIGRQAFEGCTGLTSAIIGNSVESIGLMAFYKCTGLTGIRIPDSVTSIGHEVFEGCTSLTSAVIPDSVTSIGMRAFGYISSNEKVENFTIYGYKGTKAEKYAKDSEFNFVENKRGTTGDCTWKLENGLLTVSGEGKMGDYTVFDLAPWGSDISQVIINDGVTSIGSLAFYDCKGLTSLTIPDSVTGIGKWAFINCDNLTSITIPDSVTSIGDNALGYTVNLMPYKVNTIEDFAIYGYKDSAAENYANTNGFSFVELIGLGERLEGYSISLEGDIAVNFYMSMPDEIANNKDVKMHFEIPGGDTVESIDVSVSEAEKKTVNNKTYYIFKCPVAAKEMTSQIKGYLTLGNTKGIEYTYTIKEYADYILSHTEVAQYAEAAPLVKAMLNYGAYSQLWFDKNTTALANSALDDSEKTLSDVSVNAAEPNTDGLPDGVSFEGSSLSLKSNTTLSLYFKGGEELSFSCGDLTVETETSGDYTVARVRGIKADELSDVCTLTVESGDTSGTVSYVPTYYLKYVLENDGSSDDLKNVAKALYIFHVKAEEYFNRYA